MMETTNIRVTVKDAVTLHNAIIERTGGSYGLRDRGCLESSLLQPFQSAFGEDIYPTIYEKAARCAFNLIKNHPFVDGNKRIACVLLASMLESAGYHFEPTEEDVYNIINSVAASTLGYEHLLEWAQSYSL